MQSRYAINYLYCSPVGEDEIAKLKISHCTLNVQASFLSELIASFQVHIENVTNSRLKNPMYSDIIL